MDSVGSVKCPTGIEVSRCTTGGGMGFLDQLNHYQLLKKESISMR